MPPYRMQTLLEIRQRAEEAAKQAFAEATQALAQEERKLQGMIQDLERRKKERQEQIRQSWDKLRKARTQVQRLNTLNTFQDRLKDEEEQLALDIEAQKAAVAAAKRRMEQKRLEMVEATRELKAIEKHKEQWLKAVRAERDRRDDLRLEEVANSMHVARTRHPSSGGGP